MTTSDDLGAYLLSAFGPEGLRGGPFDDKRIDEWVEAREESENWSRDLSRMPKVDLDFAIQITTAINEWVCVPGDILIVVPGPLDRYFQWLLSFVYDHSPRPVDRRLRQLRYYNGGLTVHFMTENMIKFGSNRGRCYDEILLHDEVSWKTYLDVRPCKKAR
jgi:hypothetical protein